MSYKFSKIVNPQSKYSDTQVELTLEKESVTYMELCEVFEDFLKGCGFLFDGHIQVVNEEDSSDT